MSNDETLQSTADLSKSDQNDDTENASSIDAEGAVIPPLKNQNADEQCTESMTPNNANDQITKETKKETEIVDENSEIIAKSTEEITQNTIPETSEIQQSPADPEVQQQTIGAGDTCFVPKRDENANDQKTQEGTEAVPVNNQTPILQEKSLVEDKEVNEEEFGISKLKEEFQKVSEERDSYKKKLESIEKKLAILQASYDSLMKGEGDEVMLRRMVDQLKSNLIQTSLQLEDRIRVVTNQEKQISALNSQVSSLKEVESLTRSLLQIRNMEVKHLQAEVDDMEVRINEERDRYNTMINKMDAAVKLNADLKKEYETQLCLFRDLREKYEEKVTLLSEEKRALENAQSVPK